MHTAGYIIAIILAAESINSDSTMKPIDEFYIEHEVTGSQARKAVKQLDSNIVETGAGCKLCTKEEIRYCLGSQLINDHCCCDRRYKEFFPYIPHTCYIGEHFCETLAHDCAEYSRLRICCCNFHVLKKWKLLSNKSRNLQENWLMLLLAFPIYLFT